MRTACLPAVCMLTLACSGLHAQDLSEVCRATSSYDLTVRPDRLVFDRAAPAPARVVIEKNALQTDGRPVVLTNEQQDRLAVFDQDLRALIPRVKAVANHAVDLAMQAIQQESDALNLDAEARAELQHRLSSHAAALHQRIAASESTHDWHGDAAEQYANQVIGDIAPLLASALGEQAISAAMNGDLQQAAALRDQATHLAADFEPRLQRRLQALRPEVQALCPEIQRLAGLQEGLRAADGRPLHLLQLGQ